MLCVCIGGYCIFLYSDLDLVHSQTIIQYIHNTNCVSSTVLTHILISRWCKVYC